MPFNYPWTCEAIDSNITIILDKIRDHLIDEYKKNYQLEVYELTPDMQSEIEIEAQVIYCNIKEHIEAIRLTNSGIRTAAEDQVQRLEDAIDDLKDDLLKAEKEYGILQRDYDEQIDDLNNTIEELEFVIKRDGYRKDGRAE